MWDGELGEIPCVADKSIQETNASQKMKKWLTSPAGTGYFLVLPSLIVIFGIIIWPIFYSIYISLHQLYLVHPGKFPFVGLENYLKILQSRVFWAAVGRTFYFTGASVGVAIIIGLGIALVLNQDFKGRAFMRGLIILPWALSSVVNGMMWKWIYDGSYGALNGLLLQLGWIDSYKVWLANPRAAMNFVIVAEIWKETPVGVLFILASLQTIPSSLYQAAKVDGAGAWRRFRYITLPLLKHIILLLIVIKSVWAVRDSFDIVYMITRGGPAESTQVVTFYAYLTTFKFLRFGYGAALSYLITLIILVFAVVYMRLVYTESLYAEAI